MNDTDSPAPSGESATAEERLRVIAEYYPTGGPVHNAVIDAAAEITRLHAEVERLTAERESHGPEGRNVTNAQHLAMRERALFAEARAARLEEALATLAAFARTAPGRLPDEVQRAVDLVPWDGEAIRNLNPEGV